MRLVTGCRLASFEMAYSGVVNLEIVLAVLLGSFRFGQTDRTDSGMSEQMWCQ